MQVVALCGRRVETAAWMRSLLDATHHADAEVIRYRHWDTSADASVTVEAARLSDRSPRLVVAKSLGTVIAATAHASHRFRPSLGIFIGTPYAALEDADVRRLARFAADVDTLFIQQAEDPGGPAARLAVALDVRAETVVEVPGDDHLYADVDALAAIVRGWEARRAEPRS